MARTAFVTGATGFLGLNLVEQLAQAGWKVTALHRPTSDLRYLKRMPASLVEGSIEDPVSLGKAMPDGFDAVFHVAADVNFWSRGNRAQTRTNIDGTRNMLAAAKARAARRFIHTSSLAVFGLGQTSVDESSPKLGKNSWINYMRTKSIAEEMVLEAGAGGLDVVILNPANIVGRYDRFNWARMFRLIADRALPGVPGGRSSFCHVGELARAHISAYERGRKGECYLVGGVDATYQEVAALAAGLISERPPRAVPALLLKVVGLASHWGSYITNRAPDITPELAAILSADLVCRSDKAIKELGYQPQSLDVMFRDCYDWLAAEGLLRAA
jgi:nucleoside-diphosphate-sugar epimerase